MRKWLNYRTIFRFCIIGCTYLLTIETALLPKISFKTATHRPTITSSLTVSITLAASPATRATSTGPRNRFQNKNNSPVKRFIRSSASSNNRFLQSPAIHSPRLCVVLATWPNKFAFGSQNTRSKQSTTLLRFPKPSRWIDATFQSGKGGTNWMTLLVTREVVATASFNTPNGKVQRTTSAKQIFKLA